MYTNMYISWWVYFVTGLNLVLQQPLTAALAKTKADIMKKSAYATRLIGPNQELLWKTMEIFMQCILCMRGLFLKVQHKVSKSLKINTNQLNLGNGQKFNEWILICTAPNLTWTLLTSVMSFIVVNYYRIHLVTCRYSTQNTAP